MVCVYCGGKTKVINSRAQKRLNQKWRRRLCLNCGAVITSLERVDTSTALQVLDSSRYKPFSRDKLFLSLYDSLKHRKTALRDATALTDTIIAKALSRIKSPVIEKEELFLLTTGVLKRFDKVALVHYQAFHRYKV